MSRRLRDMDVSGKPARPRTDSVAAGRCPPRVRAEVQRILDAEARRLLAEQIDRDALGALSVRPDHGTVDRRPNQRAPRIEREPLPIVSPVDHDRGTLAA